MSIYSRVFPENHPDYKRFEKLKDYFEGLNEEELLSQDVHDYVEYAEPKLKGLMDVFIRKYLLPYLNNWETGNSTVKTEHKELPRTLYYENSLFGAKRVAPSNMPFLGYITLKELCDLPLPKEKISLIDLSENKLGSVDLGYVVDLVNILRRGNKLSNATIQLSNNRIHGIQDTESRVRQWINELVRIDEIQYVLLKGNPFCTVDQMAFFKRLGLHNNSPDMPCPEVLKKLIWIPKWNVFSPGWKKMLHDAIALDVQIAHLQFYEPENMIVSCDGQHYCVSPNSQAIAINSNLSCSACGKAVNPNTNDNHHVRHSSRSYLTFVVGDTIVLKEIRDWNTGAVRGFSGN